MSWKDRLFDASYRGVPFGVRENSRSGGRRVGVHEYPLRDTPLIEELGRAPRRFSVDAYIVGDDYARVRDRLIRRLESPSAGFPFRPGGILVHPTFGRVNVVPTSFREVESTEEGRMARIAIEFVEAGDTLQPSSRNSHVDSVDNAGSAATTAAQADFAEGVSVAGQPEEVRAVLGTGLADLEAAITDLDVFGGPVRDVQALTDSLRTLISRTADLVASPATLAAEVITSLDSVLNAATDATTALEAYRTLLDFPPILNGGLSTQAVQADANSTLLANLIQLGAAVGMSRAGARIDFASLQDALAVQEEIVLKLDELVEASPDDETTFLIEKLRLEMIQAIPPPGQRLPELRSFTPRSNIPALVLAWNLYQDPTRDAELVSRNAVRIPLRIPGGSAIDVLTE